jgi:hypothetical protein
MENEASKLNLPRSEACLETRSLPRQDREKDRKREQEKDAADRVAQKEEAERRPAEKEGLHRLHPDFGGKVMENG